MESKDFNPEEFLGAKIVSPLEQEKLVGGLAATDDSIVVVVVVVVVTVVSED